MSTLKKLICTSLLFVGLNANAANKFQLIDATIDSAHAAIASHQISCVQLVSAYLNRIKQFDLSLKRGAPINAFVSLNPNALAQAAALDHYYTTNNHFKGPMHCIPVVVKDNIDTIDTPSTSGSLSMLGSQPSKNAFLVQRMKNAGAIIIGKGAMDEFASGMSGISSKSGRVGNAYNPNKNPGGSSSGPAAAVSANFAMVGIGTDNSGSVRIPAAYNGIYGLRPSTGLISQSGIFPRGNTDGVAGPIARTVKDLAITLSVITDRPDPADKKTHGLTRIKSYSIGLNKHYLEHKRIGIITSVGDKKTFDQKSKKTNAIFKQSFAQFRQLGVTFIKIKLPQFNSSREDNMAGEVQDVNHYLADFVSTRQNYIDICHSHRTYTFGSMQDCLKHVKDTAKHNSSTYRKVMALFKKNREYVTNIMLKNKLDALIMPLNAKGGASYDLSRVNTWRAAVSSNSGLPAITVTAGYDQSGMPVGVQLIGPMYGESQLIDMAYAYEASLPARPLPKIEKDANSSLQAMSIPAINNLFTAIGNDAFKRFLRNPNTQEIPAKAFRELVSKAIGKAQRQAQGIASLPMTSKYSAKRFKRALHVMDPASSAG